MDWKYRFRNPSSYFMGPYLDVPPMGTALSVGTDGRYTGVLRRYPGHIRYPDSGDALGSGSTFTPSTVRQFALQKQPGSTDRIHGMLVQDISSGTAELWYKFTGDTDGTIRKKVLSETAACIGTVSGSTATVLGTGARSGLGERVFSGTGFHQSSLLPQCTYAITLHDFDDGNGAVPVFSGRFVTAGGRICSGICKYVGGRYVPIGDFDQTAFALCSYKGHLVAGGTFGYINGQSVQKLAVLKNGSDSWIHPDGGLTYSGSFGNAYVYALAAYTIGGTEYLVVGGKFDKVQGTAITTANLGFLSYSDTTGEWSWPTTLNTDVGGVNSTVYCLLDGNACTGNTAGLFIGGNFTADAAASGTFNRIVRLTVSGTTPTWTALGGGTGVNGIVTCMTPHVVSGSIYLHFGGGFTAQAGGSSTSLPCSVAYISGTGAGTVAAVGSGSTTGYVTALTSRYLDTTPSLYIGMVGSNLWDGVAITSSIAVRNSAGTTSDVTGITTATTVTTGNPGVYALRCSGAAGSTIYWGGSSEKANVSPWTAGTYVDVASAGRFLYLLASNGEHRTIYYDADAGDFSINIFGPEVAQGGPPGVATVLTSGGRLRLGRYQGAWRAIDRVRGRVGPVSYPSADVSFAADEGSYRLTNNWSSLMGPPRSYNAVQVFTTTSSLSTDVAAGGYLYLAAEGLVNPATGLLAAEIGAPESSFAGEGFIASALNDDSFSLRLAITPDTPIPGELGDVYACAIFQGVMLAVERDGAFLQLRWSDVSSGGFQYESFPDGENYKRLDITVAQGATVRLMQCGDFMYLFGGDRIYRVQRAGTSVGCVEIGQGFPFVHRDGYVRAGTTLYGVTTVGMVQIDCRTGAGRVLTGLDRLFLDRWRGQLTPASETLRISAAHDARMDCIYFHHVALGETLCLWLTTGATTLLVHNLASNVAGALELDGETTQRAYFLTNQRWLTSPNWEYGSSTPQTMTGLLLYTGQTATKYAATATWVDNGSTVTGTFSGHPFSTDGTSGTPLDLAPMSVTLLTGALQGQSFRVLSNTSNTLTLDTGTAPADTDVVSLSPITTAVVGADLWLPSGQPSMDYRKKTVSALVNVGRVSSNGTHAQTTPAGTYPMLDVGVCRNDDVLATEPKSDAMSSPVQAHATAPYTTQNLMLGVALSTTDYTRNTTAIVADGNSLFPFVACNVSNYQFELYELTMTGNVQAVRKAGQSA